MDWSSFVNNVFTAGSSVAGNLINKNNAVPVVGTPIVVTPSTVATAPLNAPKNYTAWYIGGGIVALLLVVVLFFKK